MENERIHHDQNRARRDPPPNDRTSIEVIIRSKSLPGPPPGWRPGGSETAAGMMAEHWTEEEDRILESIERARHRPSTRELPE
jgi:hypothetical protein